jgi:hypothetical protein
VLLPLKAVLMNLLSVGAAYGVLTLAFGEIDAITPPLILAVVFGLSMDYEVFLLSRIRERYNATGDTNRAVAEGLSSSARTISSAAVIMVAVFMVFVATGLPSIQQIGLGNAVAIAVDATIVRLALVPAAMKLLGKWNWWLPRPLGRILPEVNFEAGLQPAPQLMAQRASGHGSLIGRFLRHYGEMVVAMLLGMVVLGVPAGIVLRALGSSSAELAGDAPAVMLLGMAISMTVPMVAWMRRRGHGWRASSEMSAAMFIPTLAAIALMAVGLVSDLDTIMVAEHVLMLVAMLVAMLLRASEYTHHHGPAAA